MIYYYWLYFRNVINKNYSNCIKKCKKKFKKIRNENEQQ